MTALSKEHKRFFLAQDVRGAIKHLTASRARMSHFHEGGHHLTRQEAIAALNAELAKGRFVIPTSNLCGNPCQRSEKCAGFDYSKTGGCPGHPIEKGSAE